MFYNFYVIGKFFDNGNTEAEIITAEEASERNYGNGLKKEHDTYDLYVNGFDAMEEVERFAEDCKNA